MAQKKRGNLFDRIMLGKEKSEDYARGTLPTNRWELFWDILKGRFGKLVIVNLLILLFSIPLFALIFIRYLGLINLGTMYPFTQCFGVGYMSSFTMVGYAEYIEFQVNLMTFLFLPIAVMIFSVGLSGGAYVMRNMVWTEGIFVANDFWRGIKDNIKQMLIIGFIYSLVFYFSILSISISKLNIATGADNGWVYIASQVLTYMFLVIYSIMTLHMISMSVTYKLKFRYLLKNSFLFTIGLAPQNMFFGGIGLLIFVLATFGGIISGIAVIFIALIGFSLFLLIWTDFAQWSYDRFVNDKVPGAQKNRGIYEKLQKSDSSAIKQYREQLALAKHNSLNNRPIKPITDDLKVAELPTNFSRGDLEKLRESKQAIYDDHARYVEEHKNDPEFQLSEEEVAILDKETEKAKRIAKAKKELAKRHREQ